MQKKHRMKKLVDLENVEAHAMGVRKSKGAKTMRKQLPPKAWLYPQPVLIIATYDENGKADAMNAAWGGMYDSKLIELCLGESHRTTKNIQLKGAFTVSFADCENLVASDYVGIVSGNDTPDKMEKTGWHTFKSETVDAPIIEELPLTLECKLVKFNEDGNVIGQIVGVSAEDRILDEDGNVDPGKLNAIVFDPIDLSYRKVGEKVGRAFKDGAKLK